MTEDPTVKIAELEDRADRVYFIGIGDAALPGELFEQIGATLEEDFEEARFLVFDLDIETDAEMLLHEADLDEVREMVADD